MKLLVLNILWFVFSPINMLLSIFNWADPKEGPGFRTLSFLVIIIINISAFILGLNLGIENDPHMYMLLLVYMLGLLLEVTTDLFDRKLMSDVYLVIYFTLVIVEILNCFLSGIIWSEIGRLIYFNL